VRDFYQLRSEVELFRQCVGFPIWRLIGIFWTEFKNFKKLQGSDLLENFFAY